MVFKYSVYMTKQHITIANIKTNVRSPRNASLYVFGQMLLVG